MLQHQKILNKSGKNLNFLREYSALDPGQSKVPQYLGGPEAQPITDQQLKSSLVWRARNTAARMLGVLSGELQRLFLDHKRYSSYFQHLLWSLCLTSCTLTTWRLRCRCSSPRFSFLNSTPALHITSLVSGDHKFLFLLATTAALEVKLLVRMCICLI